jgi:hypothetical protein
VGVGDKAKFLYHTWDMNDAMEAVELAVDTQYAGDWPSSVVK